MSLLGWIFQEVDTSLLELTVISRAIYNNVVLLLYWKIRYGQVKDAHLWYEKIKNDLLDHGFVLIKVGSGLLIYNNVILWNVCIVVYFGNVHNPTFIKFLVSFKYDGPSYSW